MYYINKYYCSGYYSINIYPFIVYKKYRSNFPIPNSSRIINFNRVNKNHFRCIINNINNMAVC